MDASVTRVMPWIRALPDLVALFSFSTELGEVNICLKPCMQQVNEKERKRQVATNPNKKLASEKPIPGCFEVELLVGIH